MQLGHDYGTIFIYLSHLDVGNSLRYVADGTVMGRVLLLRWRQHKANKTDMGKVVIHTVGILKIK